MPIDRGHDEEHGARPGAHPEARQRRDGGRDRHEHAVEVQHLDRDDAEHQHERDRPAEAARGERDDEGRGAARRRPALATAAAMRAEGHHPDAGEGAAAVGPPERRAHRGVLRQVSRVVGHVRGVGDLPGRRDRGDEQERARARVPAGGPGVAHRVLGEQAHGQHEERDHRDDGDDPFHPVDRLVAEDRQHGADRRDEDAGEGGRDVPPVAERLAREDGAAREEADVHQQRRAAAAARRRRSRTARGSGSSAGCRASVPGPSASP